VWGSLTGIISASSDVVNGPRGSPLNDRDWYYIPYIYIYIYIIYIKYSCACAVYRTGRSRTVNSTVSVYGYLQVGEVGIGEMQNRRATMDLTGNCRREARMYILYISGSSS
jgi:hypothetical protein